VDCYQKCVTVVHEDVERDPYNKTVKSFIWNMAGMLHASAFKLFLKFSKTNTLTDLQSD